MYTQLWNKELSRMLDDAHQTVQGMFTAWDKADQAKRHAFQTYTKAQDTLAREEAYGVFSKLHLAEIEAYKNWRDTEIYLEELIEEKQRRNP